MKIWIDFINTPQVSFWIPFIKEFKFQNYEFVFTCRDSGNTVELLKLNGLNFKIIGEKAGKGKIQKLLLFIQRFLKLYFFIRNNKPELAASQSSFYQPMVSWILRIPCLYTNDNEHAQGNLFGFLFAKTVVLPFVLNNERFTKKWPLRSKVFFYPGVKEAIYLSQNADLIPQINVSKNVIYYRPEPWSAQYYKGPLNFFDSTLLQLSLEYKIVILPRDKNQINHYKHQKFDKLFVADKPVTLKEIINNCILFIGAGGSMTRELAVLGIPVVSIYQDKMLKVDEYLADNGNLTIEPNISVIGIEKIIHTRTAEKKDRSILPKGAEAYKMMKNLIVNLKQKS